VGGGVGGDYPEFYGAGRIILDGDGDRLYDPDVQAESQRDLFPPDETGYLDFAYPPAVAAAYAPFALLPYRLSYLVHSGLLMAALAAAVLLLRPAVAFIRRRPGVAYALALTAYPMFRAVGAGQNTPLTVLLIALWWRWRWEGRSFLAGAAAGALLYKPQFAVLFLVALLFDRSRRMIGGAAASAAVLWVVGAAVSSAGWMTAFLDHALNLPSAERDVADTTAISVPFVARTLLGDNLLATVVGALIALAAAGAALLVWARRRNLGAKGQMTGLGALAAAAVIVPPHVIFYDAGLLVLTGAGLASPDRASDRRDALVLYAASFSGFAAGPLGVNPLAFVSLAALVATHRLAGSAAGKNPA
jgi:alpha-1,2-mannosyltransferase